MARLTPEREKQIRDDYYDPTVTTEDPISELIAEIYALRSERDQLCAAMRIIIEHGKHPSFDKNWVTYVLHVAEHALSANAEQVSNGEK